MVQLVNLIHDVFDPNEQKGPEDFVKAVLEHAASKNELEKLGDGLESFVREFAEDIVHILHPRGIPTDAPEAITADSVVGNTVERQAVDDAIKKELESLDPAYKDVDAVAPSPSGIGIPGLDGILGDPPPELGG